MDDHLAHLPSDLIALPTMPYDERPASLPMDIEECRTALWIVRGNVRDAAQLLKVSSLRLRNFIKTSRRLQDELKEMQDILLDLAEGVMYNALTSEDPARQDAMARFVATNLGNERGYGNNKPGNGVNINLPGKGNFNISWDDGSRVTGPPEKTIEHAG